MLTKMAQVYSMQDAFINVFHLFPVQFLVEVSPFNHVSFSWKRPNIGIEHLGIL